MVTLDMSGNAIVFENIGLRTPDRFKKFELIFHGEGDAVAQIGSPRAGMRFYLNDSDVEELSNFLNKKLKSIKGKK